MGFRQLREYYHKKYYSSEINQNEAGQLVPDLFLLFKKALYEVKVVLQRLVLIYLDSPQHAIQ